MSFFLLLMIGLLFSAIALAVKEAKRPGKPARRPSPTQRPARPEPPSPPTHHWTDDGNFDFEVVGESKYQTALRAIAGPGEAGFVEHYCPACLVPEDSNRYDNKAIAIYVGTNQVGYLSRDDARSFRRRLASRKLTGRVTSTDAVIRGGGTKDGRNYQLGIWLDMKPFDE